MVVKGSDTEVNAILQIAELYMKEYSNISISVSGGGSGAGIAGILNGNVDVANSSRELSEEEIKLAEERSLQLLPIVFARDVIVFITHIENPLQDVSEESLRQMFKGEITKWPNGETISLYGRQNNSGTYRYLQKKLLGADYSRSVKQLNGNAQILEAVKQDKSALAYISLGYAVKGQRVREGIKMLRIDCHYPLSESQEQRTVYPFVRPLYQLVSAKHNQETAHFVTYVLENGGEILEEYGYLKLPESEIRTELNKLKHAGR